MKRTTAFFFASGAALLLAFVTPVGASAHVTVSPDTAPAGSYALVNIKVPNESATAVTVKIEVSLPTDTPIASVSYVPVAGWETKLERTQLPTPVKIGENTVTEAVTKVVWTATPGNEISAGQLQVFGLSLGPVPDTGKIVLAADQYYSDNTVVSWDETGTSASHPAPVLYVNDAPPADGHGEATPTNEAMAEGTVPSTTASDSVARALGVGGLVVGAISIVLAVAATRRKAVK